jgi:ribosomal protein S18 acetylase RimI-like enzyme
VNAAGADLGALRARDSEQAVQVLARAFRDNPLNVAVIGSLDPVRRVKTNAHGLRTLLPVAAVYGRVRGLRRGDLLAAVLVAAPPGGHPLPPAPLGLRLRSLLGQGLRVSRRWAAVFDALAPLHPPEPHWYLGTLGVEPEQQGRGLGSRLLADWLAEVDRDAVSAYLETDKPENVAFYARVGFEVVGETRIFGVAIRRMRRPPSQRPAPPD